MTDLNPLYADSCERCMYRAAVPHSGIREGDSLTANYRCPSCGHTWSCSWGIVPGRILPAGADEQPTTTPLRALVDDAIRRARRNTAA